MANRIAKSKITEDESQQPADDRNCADSSTQSESGITRREILKLTASAIVAAPLSNLPTAQAATDHPASNAGLITDNKAPLFFTRNEFKLVDELTELMIPTDEHSPGARAANVAAYLDARLAESFEEAPKQVWRDGLKLIESLSQEMHGQPFLQASQEQRIALLTRISQNEMNPKKPEEIFFRELKARTAHAYYTSKIGIHTEMQYKGNTYLKEFVGVDAT